MEFGTVTGSDVLELIGMYIDLIEEVRDESRDDYLFYDTERAGEIARDIWNILDDPQKTICVARDGGCIAGFIAGEVQSCCLFPLSRAGPVGYVTAAYVRPAYRRKGIGRRLESMLVHFFQTQGAAYAELGVMSKHRAAKESWTALGYATFREQMRKRI
ncbi:MAG: GNAT family N-acetyltransferase [Methanomicrobiaceae archaeon]|nr:GNAT family N-acetyltransferase [Methanomicrobiaceae archaeon]MDD5420134.1 GNAT family N-acetyltransferase [Methanomicrobiaceae archaeon]